MKILVAIPTYNEKDNIKRMISAVMGLNANDAVRRLGASLNLVVIDDNSPDGTQDIIRSIIQTGSFQGSLFLIAREKKSGLGTAYVAAFKFAVEKAFDYVVTMDCDFSHDPAEIINFINAISIQNTRPGMIAGSRYKDGVRVINWSMKRLLISYFANIYAKTITGVKISDLTGGFNMYDTVCLKKINLEGIKSKGYAFQIEMKFRMVKEAGCNFVECPIIFYERTEGKSKMSNSIIFEAFFKVISLRFGFYR